MPAFICTACGTQYPPSDAPPTQCMICEDERQYVPPGGQSWTTLAALAGQPLQRLPPARAGHHRHRHPAAVRHRPARAPSADAQRQRAVGLHLDPRRRDHDADQGARRPQGDRHLASAFLHDMVEWSRAFGDVPVHLHAADRDWIMRPDPAIKLWDGETLQLLPGRDAGPLRRAFPGGTMLHWAKGAGGRGVVCSADIATVDRTASSSPSCAAIRT